LLLLLILMAVARRNARREAELTDSFVGQSATDNGAADAGIEGDDFNVALAAAQDNTPDELDIAEDPLVEADALIAYGKLDQAADALQSAIYEEPERTDLRLKLMEVEALRENPQGYAVQAEALRRMGVDDAAVEMMNARYPLMAAGLMTGAALLSTAAEEPVEEPAAIETDIELEESEAPAEPGEFDFTDFGLEEESAASLADTQVESEVGFDLDFDLDADELQENPDQALDAALTDLAAAEPQEPAVIEPAPLDDFELNLDDELQADNLLAEFEAMSLAGADNESAAPAAGEKEDDFTLTDEDLAGFEAELQAVMGNAAADQQDDQPLAGSDLANGFDGEAMATDGLRSEEHT